MEQLLLAAFIVIPGLLALGQSAPAHTRHAPQDMLYSPPNRAVLPQANGQK